MLALQTVCAAGDLRVGQQRVSGMPGSRTRAVVLLRPPATPERGMKYRTLVADPPWDFQWNGTGRWPGSRKLGGLQYSTMGLSAILTLPVAELAESAAALFLWVPASMNREGVGVAVARAWGFDPVSEFVWAKGMRLGGSFPRVCHEIVLVCRRGEHHFTGQHWIDSVQRWRLVGQGTQCSIKPDGFLDMVEQNSPGPYVELFSRRHRLGWDVWGNESANTAQLGPVG